MVDEEGKTDEDKVAFDSAGQAIGYISMDQARVLAMQTANETPGNYGRRHAGVRMVFDVVEEGEGEDYYTITLSFRPEGEYKGTPGQEQFFIEKEGKVAYRQVRGVPQRGGVRRLALISAVVLVLIVAGSVGGVVFAMRGSGGDGGTPLPAIVAGATTVTPMPSPSPTFTATVVPEASTPGPPATAVPSRPSATATPHEHAPSPNPRSPDRDVVDSLLRPP